MCMAQTFKLVFYFSQVGTEDMKGLDFIVFEEPEMTIVSCHVEGNSTVEQRKHLMVEIKSAGDAAKIESAFPLPISNFFQVKDLPKGRYLLRLRSGLPLSSHKFESDIVEVDLEKNAQIHVGPLGYRFVEDQLKQVSFFFVCSFFSLHVAKFAMTTSILLTFFSSFPAVVCKCDLVMFLIVVSFRN